MEGLIVLAGYRRVSVIELKPTQASPKSSVSCAALAGLLHAASPTRAAGRCPEGASFAASRPASGPVDCRPHAN